jgi:XTP/dITP diphosphohydrolase
MVNPRVRLVCASANPGKVAELQAILSEVVELIPRPPDVPDVVEDSGSLVGNARLKASAIAAASGLPAVADDTGLEVDALGGLPGVDTAFYAGRGATDHDNRSKLLADLASLRPDTNRRARFRTIAMVRWPDGAELWTEGTCEGEIATEERGARGFGYDSVFVPVDGDGRSFAEMTAEEKHALSHRGRAFAALLECLRELTARDAAAVDRFGHRETDA